MKKSINFILICLLLFCVFYGVRYIKSPVKTEPAILDIYEHTVEAEGYVIKTEQVYSAPADGIIYHYTKEGTRVKKNSVLSTVYTGSTSEEALAELNGITKKIEELENSGNSAYSFSSNSEENIQAIKSNIIKAKNKKTVSKVADYKMQIKSVITGTAQDIQKDNMNSLLQKKQELEKTLQYCKNDIYSQMAGVFSKNVDGLENILTPEAVANYKLADYDAVNEFEIKDKTSAQTGEPICKVVNNHIWYLMSKVDSKTAKNIKAGQSVKVRFADLPGIEAEGNVISVSDEASKSDFNIVLIKFEQYKEGVFSIRYSPVEIILESYEGYKVPISAIHIVDGEKGVMVKNGANTKFKRCRVIYTDTTSQTVIIKPVYEGLSGGILSEYDDIIIGEK